MTAKAENAVIDCTVGELAKLEAVGAAFLPMLLSGTLTWKALEDAAVNAGEDVGGCLLADVVNAVPAAKLTMAASSTTQTDSAAGPAAIDSLKKRLAVTRKIHTAKADF